MKAGQMIESNYLKKEDVGDEVEVTIVGIKQGNVAREDQEPDMKWLIKFQEFAKPMVLNSTNIQLLVKATGTDETTEWKGKTVTLYVDDNVSFGGKLVGGIRIRVPRKAAPSKVPSGGGFDDMDSDIPF